MFISVNVSVCWWFNDNDKELFVIENVLVAGAVVESNCHTSIVAVETGEILVSRMVPQDEQVLAIYKIKQTCGAVVEQEWLYLEWLHCNSGRLRKYSLN